MDRPRGVEQELEGCKYSGIPWMPTLGKKNKNVTIVVSDQELGRQDLTNKKRSFLLLSSKDSALIPKPTFHTLTMERHVQTKPLPLDLQLTSFCKVLYEDRA